MKELSIEQKAERYNEASKWMENVYPTLSHEQQMEAEAFFPMFKESKDERIRKGLINFFSEPGRKEYILNGGFTINDIIAWLEKQGSKPNRCHHEVDLSNCSEEYRKAYYDGWYNCSIQHSQCKSDRNDVIKCLINGMKFYCEDNEEATWGTEKFSMKVKDILSWLEEQGEKLTLPKWKYKKDNTPLLRDSLILNKYGCVAKSPSGAIISDAWVLDYSELAKLPKEEIEEQGEKKPVESSDIKSVLLVHDEILNNLLERYKTSATFKTLIINLQNWWNNTKRHLLSFNTGQKNAWSKEDEEKRKKCIYWLEKARKYFEQDEDLIYENEWLIKCINWLKSLNYKTGSQKYWKPSESEIKILEDLFNGKINPCNYQATLQNFLEQLKILRDYE